MNEELRKATQRLKELMDAAEKRHTDRINEIMKGHLRKPKIKGGCDIQVKETSFGEIRSVQMWS